MLKVAVPMAVLLILVLCKKIPLIGGKINAALVITGALTLLLADYARATTGGFAGLMV